jgi:hypothetical protein
MLDERTSFREGPKKKPLSKEMPKKNQGPQKKDEKGFIISLYREYHDGVKGDVWVDPQRKERSVRRLVIDIVTPRASSH